MTIAQADKTNWVRQKLKSEWLLLVPLLLTLLAFWLPFGFKVGFVGDGWFFYMNARHASAWATADRPFVPLAFILGYQLAPGSFAGFNLMLLLLLLIRSGLCYLILRRLNAGRALSMALALLVAVFPADTGIFYMGALAVYLAWDAFLLAFYMLILYWVKPRLGVLALMWCGLVLSLGIYEAPYPLILVSPFLLLLIKRRSRRQWIGMAWRWYLFPLLNGLRIGALLLLRPDLYHYQASLMTQRPSLVDMFVSLMGVYQRHFFTGWIGDGITVTDGIIALVVGGMALGVIWWLARREPTTQKPAWYGGLVLVGLAVVGLGVLVYLPTAARDDSLRTFYASSIGAALALIAIFRLLTRRALPFAVLVGVFVALGCAQVLVQHRVFAEKTSAQQTVVLQLSARVPAIAPDSALLIMDETPDQELETIFGIHWNVENPFLVAYDDPTLGVTLCSPARTTPTPVVDYCAFLADGVEVRLSPSIVWARSYDHVILVRYTAQHEYVVQQDLAPYGQSSAYQPEALIQAGNPQQNVARTMFTGAKTP